MESFRFVNQIFRFLRYFHGFPFVSPNLMHHAMHIIEDTIFQKMSLLLKVFLLRVKKVVRRNIKISRRRENIRKRKEGRWEKIRYSNKRQHMNTLSAIYGQYLGQELL